jgi:protein TonB
MSRLPRRVAGLVTIAVLVGSNGAAADQQPGRSQRPSRLITTVVDGRTVQAWGPDERGLLPVRVGGAMRPPQKVSSAPLVYPEAAKEAGVQGVVIIEALVGVDGTVQDARVLRSIPLLDEAALDAVHSWIFAPTFLNGIETEVVMAVTVNFTLPEPR